jgi:Tol biopolymer transport system component
MTLSADGKTLATVQRKNAQNLSISPGAGSASPELPSIVPSGERVSGFGWDTSGNLLIGESGHLSRMRPDGTNSSQVLGDAASAIVDPAACGTRYIVFSWVFHAGARNANIWRANADGSNPVKLTDMASRYPLCSPDGKWVYYENDAAGQMWRVPADGSGKAEVIPGSLVPNTILAGLPPSLAPDGKLLGTLL